MLNRYLGGRNFEKDRDRLMIAEGGGGGGTTWNYLFIPCLGGNESGGSLLRRTWMDDDISRGVNINSSGDQVSGIGMLPSGVTSVEVYPILNASGICSIDLYFKTQIDLYGETDYWSSYIEPTINLTGGFNWCTSNSITLDAAEGALVNCYIQAYSTPTNSKKVFVLGWVVIL